MKKELLSPAGDFNTVKQAIHNGCDAVYLGGKKFGARKFASNFDDEEMIKAIQYCHLYGVKIYVTVNTLIYEEELEDAINYIRFLHKNGVDAIIMQDIGLIKRSRELFPNLEIHASTQMHTHNQKQLKLLEELGIKRVVLAREMSMEEIKELDTNMEIEVFVHGALCICYSGQCLFSSLLLNRSGNRGECAGVCRLPFELVEEDKTVGTEGNFLLSPRELNTLAHVDELMESNITSFKIEGRMKNSTTIGFITRLYRMLMDHYQNHEPIFITEEEQEALKMLFNREFTDGYLFHSPFNELMNIKSPNHIGVEIGEVIEITADKIKMKLKKELNQGDGIRFLEEQTGMIVNFLYDENDMLVSHGKVGEIVSVDNKVGVTKLGLVSKTTDCKLIERLEKYTEKRIPISIKAIAKLGKPFQLQISDDIHTLVLEKDIIEEAQKNATTKERIKEQLEKLGNTPFSLKEIELEINNNLFIPIKEINEARRELISQLIEVRQTEKKEFIEHHPPATLINYPHQEKTMINALVRNEEQLKACMDQNVDTIYLTDGNLYLKYQKYPNIYMRLERVQKKHQDFSTERLLITETGSLSYQSTNEIMTDYYFNVGNHQMIEYLSQKNVKRITLSIEMPLDTIQNLKNKISDLSILEVIVYGRIEVMITKYCPLKMFINHNQVPCQICRNKKHYFLKDRNHEMYPLLQTNEITHIFYYRNLEIQNLSEYQKLGIKNYRLEFLNENYEETIKLVKKVQNLLA